MGGFDLKRMVLTMVLVVTTWMIYMKYFGPRPQAPTVPVGAPAKTSPAEKAAGQKPVAKTGDGKVAAEQPAPSKSPEQKVELETPEWKATFSSYGAALEHFVLKARQYQEKVSGKLLPIDLVRTGDAYPLATELGLGDFHLPGDAVWNVVKNTKNEIEFSWEGEGIRISKRYAVGPGPHALDLSMTIENLGEKTVTSSLELSLFGRQVGQSSGGGLFGFAKASQSAWEADCYTTEAHRKPIETLRKEGGFSAPDLVKWIAISDRYFMLAVAPDPQLGQRRCRLDIVDESASRFRSQLLLEGKTAPGKQTRYVFAVYAGPKLLRELDAVQVAGQSAGLGEALDYGWWSPIARIMVWILVTIHRGIGSWGLAIIVLTVLMRLLLYPLTQKSLRSSKEMAKLKPKLESLQQRYKDDKQRLNAEMMKLYKDHGVNPLGGCLPILIQFPIWMALYRTLGNAVELYRSNFLWMPDLTQADPFYVTPILTGILMFMQQRMTPMPTDNQQQQMMMYMMPIIFTIMSLWFPAGLTIYILTSTLLGMAQQWRMNRSSGASGQILRPARAS